MERELLKNRLQMIEQRVDRLGPAVSALVERVMSRPVVIKATCPKCGTVVQIMLTSGVRSASKSKDVASSRIQIR